MQLKAASSDYNLSSLPIHMNWEWKRKIIWESRANKYIIPFSRKEVRVWDYILFWYDESDNKGSAGRDRG